MAEMPAGLMREGFLLLAATAGPFIGGLLVVGLVVGVLQAATQINDPPSASCRASRWRCWAPGPWAAGSSSATPTTSPTP